MSKLRFSIIIPTYNRADKILATVDSVLHQSYPDFEIIVVDDGSRDNTLSVLSEINDPRVRIVSQVNSERGAARNAGAKLAAGDYLSFLDSDDFLMKDFLQNSADFIHLHPRIPIFHTDYIVQYGDGRQKKMIRRKGSPNSDIMKGNFLCLNSVMMRADVAKENPFSEDRRISTTEDWELWIRLAAQYRLVHFPVVNSALVYHSGRSVLNEPTQQLITRFQLFMPLVLSNENVAAVFRSKLQVFKSSCYSYIALHVALNKDARGVVAAYFFKSVIAHPPSLFSRRTLAILKHFF